MAANFWAAFWRSKRVAVKLAAAVMLPIGLVVVWVVGSRMLEQATSIVGSQ